jgi:hypothetical protein
MHLQKRKWIQIPVVPICPVGPGVVSGRRGFLAAVPYFIPAIFPGPYARHYNLRFVYFLHTF